MLSRENTGLFEEARRVYDFLAEVPPLPARADLILAAGTYDLRVADHAASLYLQGYAPTVVCSGGFGKVTSRLFSRPEGELFAERCIELGVPETAVIVEGRSTNTGENFRFTRELIRAETGIVACKPYMAKRAWATGTKQWPEVTWYASGIPLPFEEYPTDTITLEDTIQLMVGDLQRLWTYEQKGFQVHVDAPERVMQAYHRLVEAGYDRYVTA
ncbi:MAG: YdcF family protein [Oscillospiraceae bacterium]|nr:YdcF family protein [Oscillospiraceae bacterium]